MLKIKDNVDLKELEKFGFRTTFGACWYFKDFINSKEERISISVSKDDRRIQISYDTKEPKRICSYFENLDIFFDLIQAGLVEKV